MDSLQKQLDDKWDEYGAMQKKIDKLPAGSVRLFLKRKRANFTGEIVALRQRLIAEQVDSVIPVDIPRVTFDKEFEKDGADIFARSVDG